MRIPEAWEGKWKRFLYEDMSAQAINAEALSRVFGYFHVSEHKLTHGDFFKFTPRLPRYPYTDFQGNVTEDDFTPRISVAPTVNDALEALEGQFDGTDGWAHLYAGVGHADAEAKVEDCAEDEDPNNQYGQMFYLARWLKQRLLDGELSIEDAKKLGMQIPPGLWPPGYEEKDYDPNHYPSNLRPSMLPNDLQDEFEYCVPDADETKEQWLLQPTTLIYIGELEVETGDVILSTPGLKAVKQAGLKTHSY